MIKLDPDYLKKIKKSAQLHSPSHVLADELATKFSDKKHFGFYLKMAITFDHGYLRRLAGEVMEQKPKNPGALFAFLIKKDKKEKSGAKDSDDSRSDSK